MINFDEELKFLVGRRIVSSSVNSIFLDDGTEIELHPYETYITKRKRDEDSAMLGVKVEANKTYKRIGINGAYAKVTKLVFDEGILRMVEFTDELGKERFMGMGLFECEYEIK